MSRPGLRPRNTLNRGEPEVPLQSSISDLESETTGKTEKYPVTEDAPIVDDGGKVVCQVFT